MECALHPVVSVQSRGRILLDLIIHIFRSGSRPCLTTAKMYTNNEVGKQITTFLTMTGASMLIEYYTILESQSRVVALEKQEVMLGHCREWFPALHLLLVVQ